MTTNPPDQNPEYGSSTPPPPAGGPAYGGPQPGHGAPPPAPGGGYGGSSTQPPLSDSDQRMWSMLAHLGGILFGFLAPLIIWLVFRERGRFVDEQSKEALNFQILLLIGYIISSILTVILIGVFMLFLVWLAAVIFGIIAGLAANRGEAYRYPFNLRLIK